jgi:hypothetical protein
MRPLRHILLFLVALLVSAGEGTSAGAGSMPPAIAVTGTSTLGSGGRPWFFIALGDSAPGLVASRRLAVYAKQGVPDSPATFVSRGAITPTTDPTAIAVLLSRSANLGDNLGALEARLVALHKLLLNTPAPGGPAVDPPSMTLATRLAALMARAASDSSLATLLDAYGMVHPGLRLVRGTAWGGPIDVAVGSPVTFEVRELNPDGSLAAVIGRITLAAGQGDPLPAPGPMVVVPNSTASGDLVLGLRWATPDALRLTGARHHGDVVWRVARAAAESRNFHTAAPTASALDALAAQDSSQARRLAGPVFPSKVFTALEAGDFVTDPATVFAVDDNERGAAGGTPAAEGAQFYYFVAALDALGRPGTVSSGVLGTFCRRLAPGVPARLEAATRWIAQAGAVWEVRWNANPAGEGVAPTRYELFRGTDLSALALAQRGGLDLAAVPVIAGRPDAIKRVGLLGSVPGDGGAVFRVTDPVEGGPGVPWWYSVRAVHAGPPGCGETASALSPPVFVTWHDRGAPPAPAPGDFSPLPTECLLLGAVKDLAPADEASPEDLGTSELHFIVRADVRPGISGCHFRVVDSTTAVEILPDTLVVPGEGDTTVELDWSAPLSLLAHSFDVQCQPEAVGIRGSAWAHSSGGAVAPEENHRIAHHFLAGAIARSELPAFPSGDPLWDQLAFTPPPAWDADLHLVVSPYSGAIFHPRLCLALAPGTEQYRVYRRVGDGPLTLMAQGLMKYAGPGCALTLEDPAPPVWNGRVEYFTQLLDENGRAGAMRRLRALTLTGDPPPVPLLQKPDVTDFGGNPDAATVTLSWSCPPERVERFELFVETVKPSSDSDRGVKSVAGSVRQLVQQPILPAVFSVKSRFDTVHPRRALANWSFLTGRVRGDLGPGPKFNLPLQLDPSLRYTVWMRALGPNNEPGAPSRSIEFQWQPPLPPPDDVPWPARPLPPVAGYNPGIQAVDFATIPANRRVWSIDANNGIHVSVDAQLNPVGIRIGSLPIDNDAAKAGYATTPPVGPVLQTPTGSATVGKVDPNQQVFAPASGASGPLLPCVLYRQQVANDAFPAVSGDVIQCSPLVRSIAWEPIVLNARVQLGKLTDPLFCWLGPVPRTAPNLELFLLDTQPVVTGARYRYWLLRFSSLGEPVQTIPCGEVTIQSQ